jgi:hypothetical protein
VTFRIAAVLSAVSAAWELLTLQSEALLFGAVIGGTAVAAYHVFFALLFGWLALGLWRATPSGYYTLIVAAVIYTVDRLQALVTRDALATFIRGQLAGHEDLLQTIGMDSLLQAVTLMTAVAVACWWGFVAYAYFRRRYFGVTG